VVTLISTQQEERLEREGTSARARETFDNLNSKMGYNCGRSSRILNNIPITSHNYGI
jgi:hypothetical protein